MTEDLKKQFEEIEKRIEAGESVQINLNDNGKSVQLLVDENDATDISDLDSLEAVDDGTAKYDIDVSAPEMSKDEIANIIDDVPPLEALSDLPDVVLTKNENSWVLHQDCTYKIKTAPHYEITALKGFETDLASIPRVFWAIISADELSLAAPVFHDLLYRRGGVLPGNQINPNDDGKRFERKEVDDIFLEIMETAEIPKWKRKVAYRAVRTFAGFAWQG